MESEVSNIPTTDLLDAVSSQDGIETIQGLTSAQYDDLRKIKEKSEDDYEKNIVYIGAGTLVLSLTFIEKIVPLQESIVIWFLISSWAFLVITLLINLVSHQLSSKFHDDCMSLYSTDRLQADLKVNWSNKFMRTLNWVTSGTLIIGIILLVLFCSCNAYKMSKEKQQAPKPQSTEKLGRTISLPTPPKATSISSGNTNSENSTKGK